MKAYKYETRVDTVAEGFVPLDVVQDLDLTLVKPLVASVYMHNFGDSWTCLEDHNNLTSAVERTIELNRQFDLVASIVNKKAISAKDIELLREVFNVDEFLNWRK